MFTRRNLLFGLLFVAVVFGAMHIFRGSSNKTSASKQQTTTCVTKTSGKHHRPAHSGKLHKQKTSCATSKSNKKAVAALRVRRPVHHPVRAYARRLLPVVDRSRAVFDLAAAGSVSGTLGRIGNSCITDGIRVNLLTARVDGVAYSGAWYSRAAQLHNNVLTVYHNMEGALQSCVTGAGNDDFDSTAQAQNDIASADHAIRALDDHLHALARSK